MRARSEEHTSELQSLAYLVCRLLLEKKKKAVHCARACPSDSMRRIRARCRSQHPGGASPCRRGSVVDWPYDDACGGGARGDAGLALWVAPQQEGATNVPSHHPKGCMFTEMDGAYFYSLSLHDALPI